MRYLVILQKQLVFPLLAPLDIQGTRFQPGIGNGQIHIGGVLTTIADVCIADEEATLVMKARVFPELEGIVRNMSGPKFQLAANSFLKLTVLAAPF
jgi:hypothetical protein